MTSNAKTVLRQIRMTAMAGAALCCMALPSDAAPSDPTQHMSPGLVTMIAQQNALEGSQEALQKLQHHFNRFGGDEQAILDAAAELIAALPEGEVDAAWRIGAAAQLAVNAGRLSEAFLADEFELPEGAVAWDFGPEGAKPYPGFQAVEPEDAGLSLLEDRAVESQVTLQDGIAAVKGFEAPLANGIYRVVLLSDSVDETKRQGGVGDVVINGDAIEARGDAESGDDLLLEDADIERTDEADAEDTQFRGTGVEGVAFVANGQLVTEFSNLPADRYITAVIAIPVDYEDLDLTGPAFDLVTDFLSGLATAAGPGIDAPAPSSSGGGNSGSSGGNTGGTGGTGQANGAGTAPAAQPATGSGPVSTGGIGSGGFGTGFSNFAGAQVAAATPVTASADFINDTPFSPGNSPGIEQVDGNFIQTEDGTIDFEIGGVVPGVEFDQLLVEEDAFLRSGGIDVTFIDLDDEENSANPFTPEVDDFFDVVIAENIVFTDTDFVEDLFNFPAAGLPDSLTFTPTIITQDGQQILRISVKSNGSLRTAAANVPAPAGLGLLGFATLLLIGARRRAA